MSNRYISELFSSGEEFEEFLKKVDAFKKGVEAGTIVIPKAGSATKATQDGDGNVIKDTYAKTTDLTSGAITVKKANEAASATTAGSATKATQDGDGNVIPDTYAKKSDLENGTITVKNARLALKASEDSYGNNIASAYAKKEDLTSGAFTVKKANEAESSTKATKDGDGNVIKDTYAKKAELLDGTITVKKATIATDAETASIATRADRATYDAAGNVISATYAKKKDLEDGTFVVKKADADINGNSISATYAKTGIEWTEGTLTTVTTDDDTDATHLPGAGVYMLEWTGSDTSKYSAVVAWDGNSWTFSTLFGGQTIYRFCISHYKTVLVEETNTNPPARSSGKFNYKFLSPYDGVSANDPSLYNGEVTIE